MSTELLNLLQGAAALIAVIISIVGYFVNKSKTQKTIAKAHEAEKIDKAVKEANLKNRLDGIEIQLKGYSKLNETLEKLDCTLEGIKIVLAEHKIEIRNLKESK